MKWKSIIPSVLATAVLGVSCLRQEMDAPLPAGASVPVRISLAKDSGESRSAMPACQHANLLKGSDNPSFWVVTDENGNPFPAKVTAVSSASSDTSLSADGVQIISDIIRVEFLQQTWGKVTIANTAFDAVAAGDYERSGWCRASSSRYVGMDVMLNGKTFGIGDNVSPSWKYQQHWLSGVGSGSSVCEAIFTTWGVQPGDWIEFADTKISVGAAWSLWMRNAADESFNIFDASSFTGAMVSSPQGVQASVQFGGTGVGVVVTDPSALPRSVDISLGAALGEWEEGQDYTLSFRVRASSGTARASFSVPSGLTAVPSRTNIALGDSFAPLVLLGTASGLSPVLRLTLPSGYYSVGGGIDLCDIRVRRTAPVHDGPSAVSAATSWEDGDLGLHVRSWAVVITSREAWNYTVYGSACATDVDLFLSGSGAASGVDGTLADLDFGTFDVPAGAPLMARVWINCPWADQMSGWNYTYMRWVPNEFFGADRISASTRPALQYYGEREFTVYQDGKGSGTSVSVPLSRLDARVVLSSVEIDLPYADCRVGRYFIANVPDYVSLGQNGENCPFYGNVHIHNRVAVPGLSVTSENGLYWGVSSRQGTGGTLMYIQPDYYEDTGSRLWPLYVNPTDGRYSPLVVSVFAGGREYYYRVTLPSLVADNAYRIALRITRLGSPDPDDTEFAWDSCVDVTGWESGWESEVQF